MSQNDYVEPEEKILIYRQPARGISRSNSASSASWTDRFRRKWTPPNQDLASPGYWIYLLVAFFILILVLYGFYWILQNARIAVAQTQASTTQELALARRSTGLKPSSYINSMVGSQGAQAAQAPQRPQPQDTRGAPRLTYSPSTGLIPTKKGEVIHGGLGRDVCLGCTCTDSSSAALSAVQVPYLAPKSLKVQCGEGYFQDPFLS